MHCFPGYNGPHFKPAEDPLLSDVKAPVNPDKVQLTERVMEAMESFASGPNYIAQNVNTFMGFFVEAEVIFDKNLKPVAITDRQIFSTSPSTENIPAGASRVAVMTVGYHDCLLDSVELSGLFVFQQRLLEARGCKVFLIKHSEIKLNMKTLDRVKLLQDRLQNLLSKS